MNISVCHTKFQQQKNQINVSVKNGNNNAKSSGYLEHLKYAFQKQNATSNFISQSAEKYLMLKKTRLNFVDY